MRKPRTLLTVAASMSLALAAALAMAVTVTMASDRFSLALITGTVGALSYFLLFIALRARMLPNPHNVALIGFGKSGKTTLLTTMFSELLLFRVANFSARLRGAKTIARVTSYMEKIQLRKAVGATSRDSQFPYEINIAQNGFFGRSFKMSFGDFPGERSEEFISDIHKDNLRHEGAKKRPAGERAFPEEDESAAALFDAEFFRWVLGCEAVIFVVDVARYLASKADPELDGYAVEVSQAYIRTWSYILDTRQEGGEAREPIVVLAFTKSDLFDVYAEVVEEESFEAAIAKLGFEEPLPEVREISRAPFERGIQECNEDFKRLIRFLEGQSRTFHTVYASSFALMDGQRLGVEQLFKAVLPI